MPKEQDKRKALEKINNQCAQEVEGIYGSGMKPVFGEGNVNARIFMAGEAPGQQETLLGRPFVGKAGENLDTFLKAAGLSRDQLYISNAVKIRPVKVHPERGSLSNRPPSRQEISLFRGFLIREIAVIQPLVVATLGNVPLNSLSGDSGKNALKVGDVHGHPLPITIGDPAMEVILFPLYHPASIIYRPELREAFEQDLKALAAYLKELLARK